MLNIIQITLQKEQLTLFIEVLMTVDKAIIILKYWEGMDLERVRYILSIDTISALKMRLFKYSEKTSSDIW